MYTHRSTHINPRTYHESVHSLPPSSLKPPRVGSLLTLPFPVHGIHNSRPLDPPCFSSPHCVQLFPLFVSPVLCCRPQTEQTNYSAHGKPPDGLAYLLCPVSTPSLTPTEAPPPALAFAFIFVFALLIFPGVHLAQHTDAFLHISLLYPTAIEPLGSPRSVDRVFPPHLTLPEPVDSVLSAFSLCLEQHCVHYLVLFWTACLFVLRMPRRREFTAVLTGPSRASQPTTCSVSRQPPFHLVATDRNDSLAHHTLRDYIYTHTLPPVPTHDSS
ncbi:hypothetical protein F5Y03DRAFT_5099 [Xylaria venustula]|nr:hypothetical protein F5Y03DRAFT_5099 [Xylaria venustula]